MENKNGIGYLKIIIIIEWLESALGQMESFCLEHLQIFQYFKAISLHNQKEV